MCVGWGGDVMIIEVTRDVMVTEIQESYFMVIEVKRSENEFCCNKIRIRSWEQESQEKMA